MQIDPLLIQKRFHVPTRAAAPAIEEPKDLVLPGTTPQQVRNAADTLAQALGPDGPANPEPPRNPKGARANFGLHRKPENPSRYGEILAVLWKENETMDGARSAATFLSFGSTRTVGKHQTFEEVVQEFAALRKLAGEKGGAAWEGHQGDEVLLDRLSTIKRSYNYDVNDPKLLKSCLEALPDPYLACLTAEHLQSLPAADRAEFGQAATARLNALGQAKVHDVSQTVNWLSQGENLRRQSEPIPAFFQTYFAAHDATEEFLKARKLDHRPYNVSAMLNALGSRRPDETLTQANERLRRFADEWLAKGVHLPDILKLFPAPPEQLPDLSYKMTPEYKANRQRDMEALQHLPTWSRDHAWLDACRAIDLLPVEQREGGYELAVNRLIADDKTPLPALLQELAPLVPADKPFGKTAIELAETRATLHQMDKRTAPQRLKKLAQGDPKANLLAFQKLQASTGTRAFDADPIHDWLRENKIPGEQWDAIGQQVARHGAQRVIAAHERGDTELKGLEALEAQTTNFFLDERITFLWQQRDAIAQLLPGQDFTRVCQTVATTGKAWLEGRPVGSPEGTVALMALDQPAFSMQEAVQSGRWQPGPDEVAWLQTLPVSRAVAEALLASQAPGAAEKVLAQHDLIGGGCHLYPWLPRPNLYQALQDAPFDPESPISRAAMISKGLPGESAGQIAGKDKAGGLLDQALNLRLLWNQVDELDRDTFQSRLNDMPIGDHKKWGMAARDAVAGQPGTLEERTGIFRELKQGNEDPEQVKTIFADVVHHPETLATYQSLNASLKGPVNLSLGLLPKFPGECAEEAIALAAQVSDRLGPVEAAKALPTAWALLQAGGSLQDAYQTALRDHVTPGSAGTSGGVEMQQDRLRVGGVWIRKRS